MAKADLATADLFLQSALQNEKQTALEANRQVRYLTVPVRPIAADAPAYPRAFENTLLAFLIFAGHLSHGLAHLVHPARTGLFLT